MTRVIRVMPLRVAKTTYLPSVKSLVDSTD